MRPLFASLAIAFSMYSVFPAPQAAWKRENMCYVMACFPLVGLLIGGAIWLWLWFCARVGVTPALAAAVAVALPAVLSGGIHLDGFCDTADALGSHAPRERKLEILKDSHIGAFALIACCLYLFLLFGLWCQYFTFPFDPLSAVVLALGFFLSRCLSGLSVVHFPCAKTSGLAATFADAAVKRRTGAALVSGSALCSAVMLLLLPFTGALVILTSLALFQYYRLMAERQFGGITGDLCGWFLQLCEGLILLAVTVGRNF